MLKLPNITLFAVATANPEQAVKALAYSSQKIEFAEVKIVSHYRPENTSSNIKHEFVEKFHSIDEWNYYLFYNVWKNINTDFGLLIHEDGFIVHPESWKDEFLEYDYIGAPWVLSDKIYRDRDGNHIRVGNSVSLRSQRIMRLPSEVNIPWQKYEGNYNEDTQICVHNRHIFLQHGIRYAPLELAIYFSRELEMEENREIKPFAFHKWYHRDHPNWNYPRL